MSFRQYRFRYNFFQELRLQFIVSQWSSTNFYIIACQLLFICWFAFMDLLKCFFMFYLFVLSFGSVFFVLLVLSSGQRVKRKKVVFCECRTTSFLEFFICDLQCVHSTNMQFYLTRSNQIQIIIKTNHNLNKKIKMTQKYIATKTIMLCT